MVAPLDKNKERALRRKVERLIESGKMPTLDEVCAAVLEVRKKYSNQIRRARRKVREQVVGRKPN